VTFALLLILNIFRLSSRPAYKVIFEALNFIDKFFINR